LKYGNLMNREVMEQVGQLFQDTIQLVYEVFGERAFWLWQKRSGKFSWYSRATAVVYDPLMFVMSQNLKHSEQLKVKFEKVQSTLPEFYERNSTSFEGRKTNPTIILERQNAFADFISVILGA